MQERQTAFKRNSCRRGGQHKLSDNLHACYEFPGKVQECESLSV